MMLEDWKSQAYVYGYVAAVLCKDIPFTYSLFDAFFVIQQQLGCLSYILFGYTWLWHILLV
jgi:hypothetical protein